MVFIFGNPSQSCMFQVSLKALGYLKLSKSLQGMGNIVKFIIRTAPMTASGEVASKWKVIGQFPGWDLTSHSKE